ncbi:MAG: YjcZ family sporulation protein [Bacillota bacterium]|nr:YjcZ family sporulation protein [Bacillota bacterium]
MYCGFDSCAGSYPVMGCGYGFPRHGSFALIVVLFILLIIIGACCFTC